MQQDKKPKKHNVMSKFEDVLNTFAPVQDTTELINTAEVENSKEELTTELNCTAYGIVKDGKRQFKIATLKFNPETGEAKVISVEKEKFSDNLTLTMNNISKHLVEDNILGRKI